MINTLKHLCYLLKIRERELGIVIENTNSFYREAEISKMKYGSPQIKNGVVMKRKVNPTHGILKTLQKRIHNDILSSLAIPKYAYGSVHEKNNITNAKRHLGSRYFFSVDLKSFFPSINNRMVYKMFVSNGFSPTVANVLTKLTTYKGCLPQGTSTSPLIANLVFTSTGDKINSTLPSGITFTTFLDDLTFSSKKDFRPTTHTILKTIQGDGYWLNYKKIHYKNIKAEITGVNVFGNKLSPHVEVLQKQDATPNFGRYCYINRIGKENKSI